MFKDFFKKYEQTIRQVLRDFAMAIPLVKPIVDRWNAAKVSHEVDVRESAHSTAAVDIPPTADELKAERIKAEKAKEPNFFARLVNTLEGKKKKKVKRWKQKAAEMDRAARETKRQKEDEEDLRRTLESDPESTDDSDMDSDGDDDGRRSSTVARDRDMDVAAKIFRGRSASHDKNAGDRSHSSHRHRRQMLLTSEFREILVDTWVPPQDVEELWGEVSDDRNDLIELLFDELRHLHAIDLQQVYQLEDTYNRKAAQLEKELRLRNARRERRAVMMRKSQVAVEAANAAAAAEKRKRREKRDRAASVREEVNEEESQSLAAQTPEELTSVPPTAAGPKSILKKQSKYSGNTKPTTKLPSPPTLETEFVFPTDEGDPN